MPDTSQANQNVIMLRPDMDNLPRFAFPTGFSARPMRPQDAPEWTDIWRELTPPGMIADDTFGREFGSDWAEIGKRCFLLVSPDGASVGTISAWFDNSFRGGAWGRIHWVAIRKAFQGKGVAKPLLAMAMTQLAAEHKRCYLVTQPFRIPAISLYLKFGFLPDVSGEGTRTVWGQVAGNMEDLVLKERVLRALG